MLICLKDKNFRVFWQIINNSEALHSLSQINGVWEKDWVAYYGQVFADNMMLSGDYEVPAWDSKAVLHMDAMILWVINSISSSCAPGSNGLANLVDKTNRMGWSKTLFTLFANILATGVFLSLWSCAYIVPIFKRGYRANPASYRHIALLNADSKKFASIVLHHLEV